LQSTTSGDTRQPTSPQFHGVLSSITYPNGGYTTFTYENHRFPTATAADGDLVFDRRHQRIIEGGGFRIESIINYTADGTIASEDHYRYGFTYGEIIQQNFPLPLPLPNTYNINDHIGCGEAVVDPNLLTFMSYTHATAIDTNQNPLEFQKMVVGLPSAFKNISIYQERPKWWDAYFSANTFRTHLGGRRPVVYPEITVYHGNPYDPDECMSKTVYRYDIYSYQLTPQNYYMSTFNQTALPDTSYFEPLYYYNNQGMRCMENPARRHQLKSKSDYSYNAQSGTWDVVSEETYSYGEDTISQSGYIFDSIVSRGHCAQHTLELGTGRNLVDFSLGEFYQNASQIFGKSAMCEKYTTTLREGGTRTWENTQVEEYSYLYSGVLKSRIYTDVYKNKDLYSYVGEANENTNSVIAAMKSSNMLASLLSSETKTVYEGNDTIIISGNKVDYGSFGNNFLPFKLYERNGEVYEGSIEFISYDSFGNPTEILDMRTDVHTVFLWDTYCRYLLAMIKNATWTHIQSHVSQLMTGTSQSRYSTLKTLLPDAQIQTWDYIPLVGVSSHTDINGQTILYEYDGLGRLKREKRVVNGTTNTETLHEYEYNYMNPSL
jgi:YD repeat-containing protein